MATYLSPEDHAYPNGGQTRRGRAVFPDGRERVVWAGIPDTFYTVPAHARIAGRYVRGYLTYEYADTDADSYWRFRLFDQ